jgi:NADPH:quinone reductase-like Zn-dependent oxidoreductase
MNIIELAAPTLESFRRADAPIPEPAAGEVLVRLRAATLNYIDLAIATGGFPAPAFPLIPVADGAGEVAALGQGVSSFKAGDRVIPHFMPYWQSGPITAAKVAALRGISMPGSLAEYVAVPAHSLVAIPEHLDFAQAAALPIAATTAWNAQRSAQIRPGSVVVILGTGSVSLFALQFAKAAGATVILTSSSEERLASGSELGADHLINYRATPQWHQQVMRITGGRGADLVVDTVGEATFAQALEAAAYAGTVFTVGFLSGSKPQLDLLPIIVKALKIVGNSTGSVDDFAEAVQAIAANRLQPVIGSTYDVSEVRQAYAQLAHGAAQPGKIVLTL